MKKLLSIIVIGRNEERNLHDVFLSVKRASDRFTGEFNDPPAIVYVDSRSTDRSREIAGEHNIPCLVLEGKMSPGNARNLGARNTSSSYIFFLDGDTLLDPDFLIRGTSYLQENEIAGGVGGILRFRIVRKNSRDVEFDNYWNNRKDGERIYDGVGGTFLYRRDDLDKAGRFSSRLEAGEEFDLLLRITFTGKSLRRICAQMATHIDYKSAEKSYVARYLMSRTIFLSGRIVRQAPKSPSTIYIIVRRYWLHILYLPLLVAIPVLFLCRETILTWLLLSGVPVLNLVYKRFNLKRTMVSVVSMVFFSFGWWTGLLFGDKISGS